MMSNTHIYTHTYIQTNICTHRHTHKHTHTCTHTTHVHTHTTHMHTCTHTSREKSGRRTPFWEDTLRKTHLHYLEDRRDLSQVLMQ